MSRLFPRQENPGQGRSAGAPASAPGRQNDAPADAAFAAFSGSRGNATEAGKPAMPAMAPGYAIASSLAMSAPPRPAPARPVWTARLWLASLLLLIGASLLTLAMPERTMPPAASDKEAAAALMPDQPAADKPAVPAATTAPAPPIPAAPAAPALPAGSDACSGAMVAMNLCRKSSP
jgi:hypothetical protein